MSNTYPYPPVHEKPVKATSFDRLDMLWERYPQHHEKTIFSTMDELLSEHESWKEEFEALFNKYYGKYFVLMDKQTALDNDLFGEGKSNKKAVDFIGDYIAPSISKYALYASKEMNKPQLFKGHHAGMTKNELLIDVSAYNV